MFLPAKVLADVNTEVFAAVNCFKNVVVLLLSCVSPESFAGAYSDSFAFFRMKMRSSATLLPIPHGRRGLPGDLTNTCPF